MKHFLRIIVTILILSLAGGLVWFFCFRTKPNDVVFKELTESDILLNDEITLKKDMDGYVTSFKGYNQILEQLTNPEIVIKVKDVEEGVKLSELTNLNNITQNILKMNEYNKISKQTFDYYYILSANANKVKSKDRKAISKTIKNYNDAIKNFEAAAQALQNMLQVQILTSKNPDTSNIGYKQILEKDMILFNKIVLKMKYENDLYFSLRNYTNKYVIGSEIVDHRSAFYDVYNLGIQNMVQELIGEKFDIETNPVLMNSAELNLTKVNIVKDLLARYKNLDKLNFITEESQAFLNSFRKVSFDLIKDIYNLRDTVKNDILDDDYTNSNPDIISQDLYNSINEKLETGSVNFTSDEKTAFKKFITKGFEYNGSNYSIDNVKGIIDGSYNPATLKNEDKVVILKSYVTDGSLKTLSIFMRDQKEMINKELKGDVKVTSEAMLIDIQNILDYIKAN